MANKRRFDGRKGAKDFNKIAIKNGFEIAHIKGSHITFRRGSDVMVINSNEHEVRNELIWNLIRKFNIDVDL